MYTGLGSAVTPQGVYRQKDRATRTQIPFIHETRAPVPRPVAVSHLRAAAAVREVQKTGTGSVSQVYRGRTTTLWFSESCT